MTEITITIDVPDDYTVESKGIVYGPFDLAGLPHVTLANLIVHGAKQKLVDGIGEKTLTEEQRAAIVARTWATLQAGSWRAERSRKAGLTEEEDILRVVLLANVRAKVMAEKGYKKVKELTEADDAEIESRVDAAMARDDIRTNPGVVAACVAEKDRRESARKAKSAAKGLDI